MGRLLATTLRRCLSARARNNFKWAVISSPGTIIIPDERKRSRPQTAKLECRSKNEKEKETSDTVLQPVTPLGAR